MSVGHEALRKEKTTMSVEEYNQELNEALKGFKGMNLAAWRLLQTTVISGLVAWLTIETSADPTISVVVIAVINFMILSDLAALWNINIDTGIGPTVEIDRRKEVESEDDDGKDV